MERSARVPLDEFAAALGRLGPGEFAAFVGDVWQGTAEEVSVDPPVVTARRGEDVVRLLAAAGEPDGSPEDVDAVVSAEEREGALGPPELRRRVLYGLPPAEADAVCERYLDQPARSPEYAPDVLPDTDATGDEKRQTGGSRITAPKSAAPDRSQFGQLSAVAGPQVVIVALLAVLVLAASATAVFVGGLVSGSPGGVTATTDGAGTGPASGDDPGAVTPNRTGERDQGGREATPEELPAAETPTPTPREETAGSPGADRYADLEPTCNRSYLHVVQIQMNALKYNDNRTNDGIRTVRRFASPRNRAAVGSFERFVDVIRSPAYAPMLSYDSAEYKPQQPGEDTARVRVVTRADGNVTARYAFRLNKQEGGEYDGCWMTVGVQPLTDTTGSDVE